MKKNCGYFTTQIEELSGEPGNELLAHIEACPACREYYENMLASRRVVSWLPQAEPPPHLSRSVREATASGGKNKKSLFIHLRPFIAAAAACAVIAVTSYTLLSNNGLVGGTQNAAPEAALSSGERVTSFSTDSMGGKALAPAPAASAAPEGNRNQAPPDLAEDAKDDELKALTAYEIISVTVRQEAGKTIVDVKCTKPSAAADSLELYLIDERALFDSDETSVTLDAEFIPLLEKWLVENGQRLNMAEIPDGATVVFKE